MFDIKIANKSLSKNEYEVILIFEPILNDMFAEILIKC